MLSERRLNTLAGIFRDAGQIFFASMVIGPALIGKEVSLIMMGLLFSFSFWLISLSIK